MTRDTISRVFRSTFPDAERHDFRTASWRLGPTKELEPLFPTVLHAFIHAGRADDGRGITLVPENEGEPEETRSYGDLVREAQRFARRLAERGVRPGDRVLLVLPTSFEFVTTFFAVQMLGAIPVPSYPPALLERAEIALDRLCHIAGHAEAGWCVTTKKLRTLLGDLCLRASSVREIVAVERLAEGTEEVVDARARGADPGFIQYTSGSTGHPKGVLLSHKNLVANVHAIGQSLRINHRDVGVSWLPLYHDMGLIGVLLFCVYWRLPLVLMAPTTFLLRPIRWLKAISDHGGTLSPAPNFGFARCVQRVSAAERAGLDLSSWRLALNGAEPVNLQTVKAFVRDFGPCGFREDAMLPVYGLAESSLAVTFTTPGDPLRYEVVDRDELAQGRAELSPGGVPIVSVGRPVPGHEVLVVGEEGELLPEREVGHIVCRGPSVMEGYFRDAEATAAVMQEGWLWTGDLGYFADGRLYVTGRVKDLIIIRGRNFYAEDLELQAERVRGIRAGCAVAFGVYDETRAADVVVLVCETKATEPAEREAIAAAVLDAVQQRCGLTIDEVALVEPGSLPKTSSGKRQRALTRELYLRDALGPRKTSGLRLATVFARGAVGLAASTARRLLGRRPPE